MVIVLPAQDPHLASVALLRAIVVHRLFTARQAMAVSPTTVSVWRLAQVLKAKMVNVATE